MLVEGFMPKQLTTISAATKAAACVLTVAAGNAERLVPGASVYISGTSFALLDGMWHKISAAAGTSVTLVTATTGEAGTFTAGGGLSVKDTPTPVTQTYFAVVDGRSGYVLDAWPDERTKYRRELGSKIKGEFSTFDEAMVHVDVVLVVKSNDPR